MLLSAGIGVTPVIAMLHTLVVEASPREVWWIYGARNGREHPFAEEASTLIEALANGHSHIRYSAPDAEDQSGVDFDARGRLDIAMLKDLNVPREADFFICGPTAFMSDLTEGLAAWGILARPRIHAELFGAGPSTRRALPPRNACRPTRLWELMVQEPLVVVRPQRLRSFIGLEALAACLSSPKRCDIPIAAVVVPHRAICHTCGSGPCRYGTVAYQP